MPPGHGFGHGSVTVLVTVRGLPQSRSITLGRPDCPEFTKALSHSIIVHRTQSYRACGDLKSLGPQGPSRFEPGLRHHTINELQRLLKPLSPLHSPKLWLNCGKTSLHLVSLISSMKRGQLFDAFRQIPFAHNCISPIHAFH